MDTQECYQSDRHTHTHTHTNTYIYVCMFICIYVGRYVSASVCAQEKEFRMLYSVHVKIQCNTGNKIYKEHFCLSTFIDSTHMKLQVISSGSNALVVLFQQPLEGPIEVLLCERVNDLRHSLFHFLNCLIKTASELGISKSHREQGLDYREAVELY